MNSITLSELSDRIQDCIRNTFSIPVWIRAEISELRENGGHCYLEFVEKDTKSDFITAKLRATVWSATYRMLKPYFESSTGQPLKTGLNVLVAVTVEFHSVFGLSLNIKDIDPTYTIGELAAQRLKVIKQLEADGIADMNKQLELNKLPQRIAVISSATAAGYGDFCDQLHNDTSRYAFYHRLYPAVMQGDKAEASIIEALEKIFAHAAHFDVVVIIRGGGATTDLACFDSYELALNCTQFPLPVIAGIGHQRDVSILDMVAHTSVKTPTAAAEFLIERMQQAENTVDYMAQRITQTLRSKLDEHYRYLDRSKLRIKQTFGNLVTRRRYMLEQQKSRLKSSLKMCMLHQETTLDKLEKSIEMHSPHFLLQHGYTISTINGQRIVSVDMLRENASIRTYTADGVFTSIATNEIYKRNKKQQQ